MSELLFKTIKKKDMLIDEIKEMAFDISTYGLYLDGIDINMIDSFIKNITEASFINNPITKVIDTVENCIIKTNNDDLVYGETLIDIKKAESFFRYIKKWDHKMMFLSGVLSSQDYPPFPISKPMDDLILKPIYTIGSPNQIPCYYYMLASISKILNNEYIHIKLMESISSKMDKTGIVCSPFVNVLKKELIWITEEDAITGRLVSNKYDIIKILIESIENEISTLSGILSELNEIRSPLEDNIGFYKTILNI